MLQWKQELLQSLDIFQYSGGKSWFTVHDCCTLL